jgi:thiamine kinase
VTPPPVPGVLIEEADLGAGATWTWLAGLGGGAWRVHRAAASDVVVRSASAVEQRAAAAAADAGVGPAVVAMTAEWLVVEYLAGTHLTALELSRPTVLSELAGLLRRWHSSAVSLPEVELSEARHRYLQGVAPDRVPDGLLPAVVAADGMEQRLASTQPLRLPAHLDVTANVVATTAGLRLIDFEYAGAADPARELGQVIWEGQLDPAGADRLLDAYGPCEGVSTQSVREWAWVTAVTWTLWALSRDQNASSRRYARRSVEQMNTFWGRPTV